MEETFFFQIHRQISEAICIQYIYILTIVGYQGMVYSPLNSLFICSSHVQHLNLHKPNGKVNNSDTSL